jgi:hypothetical protein
MKTNKYYINYVQMAVTVFVFIYNRAYHEELIVLLYSHQIILWLHSTHPGMKYCMGHLKIKEIHLNPSADTTPSLT